MIRRADAHAVVYRNVPKQKRVTDLFGVQQTVFKHCLPCNKFLPISSFYLKSHIRQKTGNEVEKICCECWDKRKKLRLQLKTSVAQTSNTILEFI